MGRIWCWKTKRLGKIDNVVRSIFLASIEITGTRKKFPIAPRKRCSSTLPESRTWPTHEPPFRFIANCAASSFEGTPLSSSKLIRDRLGAEFIERNSRQVQRAPNRIGKRAGHVHGII